MKRTIYPTLVALAAAVALPAVLHAQIGETPDGTMVEMDGGVFDTDDYPPRLREDGESQIQKLLFEGPVDGKHPVVIVNGARADEKALTTLTAALRAGKAHIREGSLQVLAGDDKQAAKYGTGVNDRVILVSTDPIPDKKAEPAPPQD